MSVSSRSPTTSGRRAPVRRTHSACMAGSGLPVTSGCWPVTVADDADHRAVAGQRPARRRDGRVGVGGDVPGAVADRDDGLGQLRPSRPRGRSPGRRRPARPRRRSTTVSPAAVSAAATPGPPDRQHARARRPAGSATTVAAAWELVMTSSALGRDAELGQVAGDLLGRAGGVVGDEAQPHAGRRAPRPAPRARRARRRDRRRRRRRGRAGRRRRPRWAAARCPAARRRGEPVTPTPPRGGPGRRAAPGRSGPRSGRIATARARCSAASRSSPARLAASPSPNWA